jgi:hypothetical protein
MLIPWTIVLFLAAVAVILGERMLPRLRRRRPTTARAARITVIVIALAAATGTIVVTVLAGDAGARAVWGWV